MRAILVSLLLLTFGICGVGTDSARAAANDVTFVPGKELLADIAKVKQQEHGIALKTYLSAPGYSATLVRRTSPGSAEVHRNISDVWVVVDGAGTLVTGGALVGGRETQPGELRAEKVAGGTARPIAKGDLIGIPAGIPHWVSAIDGTQIVYLVVKIKGPVPAQ